MIKTEYLAATATAFTVVCIALCGCSARESGLYRITVSDGNELNRQTQQTEPTEPTEQTGVDPGEGDTPEEGGAGGDFAGPGSSPDSIGEVTADNGSNSPGTLSADTQESVLYVHVCGAVRTPGVYEMSPGDRIYRAIEEADGFTEDADQNYVNLAMQVSDGMKITIPTIEESASAEEGTYAAIEYPGGTGGTGIGSASTGGTGIGSASTGGTGTDSSSAGGTGAGGLININTADSETLMTIPGIGASKAAAIIRYREEHGGFSSTDEIKNVSGIGDSTYDRIKEDITVGIK